ncbi:MAG TPA: hypothetical protein VMR96_10445 [Solirubrobacterales bacterium]|nr:hypothetical protein [Solirubrobacterales bacterium]
MSDVVAVALITAGSSLIAAATGAATTYRIAKDGKETAIATAKGHNRIEMAKIEAENTRLRAQHSEDQRRSRQEMYQTTVTVLQRLHGGDRDPVLGEEWLHCLAGVQILGSWKASNALEDVRQALIRMPGEDEDLTEWQEEFADVALDFNDAVREDIGTDPHTD